MRPLPLELLTRVKCELRRIGALSYTLSSYIKLDT
jgi:hypothetical protein